MLRRRVLSLRVVADHDSLTVANMGHTHVVDRAEIVGFSIDPVAFFGRRKMVVVRLADRSVECDVTKQGQWGWTAKLDVDGACARLREWHQGRHGLNVLAIDGLA